ncbi:MAG: hypothetical protein NT040_19985 [Bacteroidetes bacterium]|nr:hypothetical protein [Bacteroidota bacterium]
MKNTIIFIFLMFYICSLQSQDVLFKKNGAAIVCKVLEINVDVIKYKKIDLKKSPLYEVEKDKIYKVKYKNGVVDVFDPVYNRQRFDTVPFSMIYVVFNSTHRFDVFPLYVNKKFIYTLKDHSRLLLKTTLEDFLTIYRFVNTSGPQTKLFAVHGQKYAINIQVKDEKASNPTDRFSMTLYEDAEDVNKFIKNEYNSFTPGKEYDFQIVEK